MKNPGSRQRLHLPTAGKTNQDDKRLETVSPPLSRKLSSLPGPTTRTFATAGSLYRPTVARRPQSHTETCQRPESKPRRGMLRTQETCKPKHPAVPSCPSINDDAACTTSMKRTTLPTTSPHVRVWDSTSVGVKCSMSSGALRTHAHNIYLEFNTPQYFNSLPPSEGTWERRTLTQAIHGSASLRRCRTKENIDRTELSYCSIRS